MVVSAVYMYMHIYVVAVCRSGLLIELHQTSKVMLQVLIVAKVQSVLLASCQALHLVIRIPNCINTDQCVPA